MRQVVTLSSRMASKSNKILSGPCDLYAQPNFNLDCTQEYQEKVNAAEVLNQGLNRLSNIRVSGGPFHYQMRSGSYGELYDEAAWKVDLGIAKVKERSGLDGNPLKCIYDRRVLLNNWVEEKRDRQHIKYDNSPKLSEYGHIYKSEYVTSFYKPVCNKARDVLLKIKSFPLTAHPIYQPELDIETLKYSAPKPESCCLDEQIVKERKEMEFQKRCKRHNREMGVTEDGGCC